MEFDAAVDELDALIQTLEREGDERALMLLDLVDAIHRPGLERIAAGELEHPHARALLAMYELAPIPDEVYVEEALDEVLPHVHEHGGEVELVEVQDGAVHLRFGGACRSGAESADELREGIERALRDRYPGFREIVAHESGAGMSLPLAAAPVEAAGGDTAGAQAAPAATPRIGAAPPPPAASDEPQTGPRILSLEGLRRPSFAEVGSVDDLPPGEKMAVDADGTPVLVANVDGQIYAVKNICATDGRSPLDGGRLTGPVIVCPWHNCAYDVRSGKPADGSDAPGLAVVPIAVRDGSLRVAVSAG